MKRSLPLLALLALPSGPTAVATTSPDLRLPLVVHLLRDDGEPVLDRDALPRFVAEVNRLYAPAGICFALDGIRDLDRDANLATVRDRLALRAHLVDGAINVFIAASIRDPDPDATTARAAARAGRTPSGWLNGAHIEAPDRVPSTYLLVRAEAGPTTLAHELGHLLGEGHHPEAGNIMSYSLERTRFTDEQLRTFRLFARRELRRGLPAAAFCGASSAR